MNLAQLSKQEIIWLDNHKCQHSHSYLEHRECYHKDHPDKERVGFLDIESSNLNADYGIILSYCIKELGTNKIYHDVITKADLQKSLDKRVVSNLVTDIGRFDRLITYYGCLTPGHKVLRKNLTWDKVENLKEGDELLSFDEEVKENGFRKYKVSKVIHNIPIQKECSEIKLSDGTTLTATNDHRWLVKRGGLWEWKRTDELIHFNGNNKMQRIMPVWGTQEFNYHSGYLAAFLDGEGCVSQALRKDRVNENYYFSVAFAQKDENIIKKLRESLDDLGFEYSIYKNKNISRIQLTGGITEKLRFLGKTQPQKIDRINFDKLEHNRIFNQEEVDIISITPVGTKVVMGLGTTSETYISEGFGSHNTKFDIPFIRTRAISQGIDFPEFGTKIHNDVYYMVRAKFNMSSRRLENACRVLLGSTDKTRIDSKHWLYALQGDKKALDYILQHNKYDVLDLEKLWKVVHNYVGKRNSST